MAFHILPVAAFLQHCQHRQCHADNVVAGSLCLAGFASACRLDGPGINLAWRSLPIRVTVPVSCGYRRTCLKYGIRLHAGTDPFVINWSKWKETPPPKKSIWLKSCLNKYSFTVIIWKIPYLLCNSENIFPSASENFSSTLASVFALPDLVLKLYWCNCMALVCQETAHFSMHTLGLFSSRQTSVQSRCVQTKLQMKTPPWFLLLLPSSSQNIPNSSYQ